MSQDGAHELYEELTQVCAAFSQRPQHHLDRLALLSFPQRTWVELSEVLSEHSSLSERLEQLRCRGASLYASHVSTPDDEWALVNFYSTELSAIPATALLLKRAHELPEGH